MWTITLQFSRNPFIRQIFVRWGIEILSVKIKADGESNADKCVILDVASLKAFNVIVCTATDFAFKLNWFVTFPNFLSMVFWNLYFSSQVESFWDSPLWSIFAQFITTREKQVLVWATDGKLGVAGHLFRDNYPCSISKTLFAGRGGETLL